MEQEWFDLDDRDFIEMVVLVFSRVKAETEKAWLISFPKFEHWFPKSQCRMSHTGDMILVPKWLYKKMLQPKVEVSDGERLESGEFGSERP